LAEKYNLEVIEDAAESLGSRYRKGKYKGKMTGTIGDIGCFSFNGNKIISSGGGGMIVTNDGEKAGHMKYLTTQAKNDELYYIHDEVGFNYRMTNLQAALGTAQLENLNYFIQIKRKNFEYYKNALNGYKGLTFIDDPDYAESNNWFYSLIVDNDEYGMTRDELLKKLREENIKVRPLWFLNHMQKPYKDHQAYKIEKALWYYHRVLNLPCSVNLTIDDIERVISVLKS
jgi:perosamine synthetase